MALPVAVERRGRVLIARLERAEKRNAMDGEMTRGLDAALSALDDEPELWVGILAGTDSVFSAGSDLRDGTHNDTQRGGAYGLIRRSRRKPLIAAVEGVAFGGGFEMVLACDLVVAGRSARFALPEVKRGLIALYGGIFRAAHALPLNIARELVLTGDALSAERAERLGLVNALCDDGGALEAALALAGRICANGPVAVRESLQVLNRSIEAGDALAWQLSAEATAAIGRAEDTREGVAAFLEKRPPRWTGR
jgi:enoyl-CoA hydratase/carnithine racemase